LATMIFHEKLGTQKDRVERPAVLARAIAPQVGADPDAAERAARLAKADLVTEMVGEFPELQGLMGRYYALAQGESPDIATAIEDHYRPVGPSDRVPSAPVAIAVALADKLDLLTGFWSIDEKPTGSKDPFALRRAALGIIRIITENGLRLPLATVMGDTGDLLAFFHDRLKVSLRDAGARHDLVDAVIAEDSDDLLQISQRVTALGQLLATEDGAALLAGYKRAANILAAEEKKDGRTYSGEGGIEALGGSEETALAKAIAAARDTVPALLGKDDYPGAVAALAGLRAPVDAFFDAV